MTYSIKPLSCDPKTLKGLSEKLIVSHWENNYGGAVKRLNAITAYLASLDIATAPVFVINGLKREELIATNSMILHELYFDGLGERANPTLPCGALTRDFGAVDRWRAEFVAMGKAMGGVRLGAADVFTSRPQTRQSVGSRSHARSGSGQPDPRARHVRAFVPYRLRRRRREVCRRVHGEYPLG